MDSDARKTSGIFKPLLRTSKPVATESRYTRRDRPGGRLRVPPHPSGLLPALQRNYFFRFGAALRLGFRLGFRLELDDDALIFFGFVGRAG